MLLLLVAFWRGSNGLVILQYNAAMRRYLSSKGINKAISPCRLSRNPQEQEEKSHSNSLDVVLERARKRNKVPLLLGKFQSSVLDRRLLPFLSIGDLFIVLTALVLLDAKGFAIGLVIGKATLSPLRKLLIQQQIVGTVMKLVDFYPVTVAVVLDQIVGHV